MSMTPILHPGGGYKFGALEQMRAPGLIIPQGDIFLFHGRHTGANRGFGSKHIWAEHQQEMSASGFKTVDDVPA